MSNKINGKQLANETITQNNINIHTNEIINPTDPTTKEYVDDKVIKSISNLIISLSDKDIEPFETSGSTPMLVSNHTITDSPLGGIRVFVNGIEVNVGLGLDCFFAPENDTTPTVRIFGQEVQGDYLWWNCGVATYELETDDLISYLYYTKKL